MSEFRQFLVTADQAAEYLWRFHQVRLSPVTIRQWAHRQHIGRHRRAWACYDLREIERHARKKGLIAKDPRGS